MEIPIAILSKCEFKEEIGSKTWLKGVFFKRKKGDIYK